MAVLPSVVICSCKADNSKGYVLVDLYSTGFIVSGQSLTDIGGGRLDFRRSVSIKKPVVYSQQECIDKIKDNLVGNKEYNSFFEYKGNGAYSIGGAWARYICVQNIHIKANMINEEQFITKYFMDKLPQNFIESEVSDYTIFPLDKNQKTARKLTDQLDKELSKVGIEKE